MSPLDSLNASAIIWHRSTRELHRKKVLMPCEVLA